jgi:Domain of unknown function (DUF4267)
MYRRHRGSSAEVRRDKNGSRGLTAKPTRLTRSCRWGTGSSANSWTAGLCRSLSRESELAVIIGFWLSGAIALGIVLIGMRFSFAPHAAATGYGVSVGPDPRWEAYLSAKAVRDIASGVFVAILILNRSAHLLGWFMLAATIIPAADAAIVLRHGGTRTAAFGIHGVTAGTMMIISCLLLLG